jgi:hypothetical protein
VKCSGEQYINKKNPCIEGQYKYTKILRLVNISHKNLYTGEHFTQKSCTGEHFTQKSLRVLVISFNAGIFFIGVLFTCIEFFIAMFTSVGFLREMIFE